MSISLNGVNRTISRVITLFENRNIAANRYREVSGNVLIPRISTAALCCRSSASPSTRPLLPTGAPARIERMIGPLAQQYRWADRLSNRTLTWARYPSNFARPLSPNPSLACRGDGAAGARTFSVISWPPAITDCLSLSPASQLERQFLVVRLTTSDYDVRMFYSHPNDTHMK